MMYYYYKFCLSKKKQQVQLFCLSLVITIISGIFLFRSTLLSQVSTELVNFGLDPLRSHLLAALMLTMLVSLVSGFLSRREASVLIGAGVIFWFYYLNAFIQLELRPTYDPGGNLEPLVPGTLVHTGGVLLALAILSAFFGVISGVAMGKLLLDPFYRLVRWLWQSFYAQYTTIPPRWQRPYQSSESAHPIRKEGMLWIQAALFGTVLLLASQSGPLFLFSPEIGIHAPPPTIVSTHSQGEAFKNQKGVLKQDSLISQSLHLQQRSFMVYLPPSYTTQEGKEKRYPVIYLLHGVPGGEDDWFSGGKADESADTLIDTQQISEVIVVAPDGNGQSKMSSEWGNSGDQSQLMETFVAKDLVSYVDEHYRTLPDAMHRAIGGLSMGGFGAMNIALHHPDLFGTVVSLGGYYQAEGAIWGKNTAYIQQNSPLVTLLHDPQAWTLHIYLGAATHDQPYYTDAKQFMQELDSLHIAYQFDLQDGYHSWHIWQVQLYHALLWMKWR